MTIMVRHVVLLLFALAISSVTAKANTITLNYDFSASGFGFVPVDPVTGSFSVTFDDAVSVTDVTSGIVVSNLNIPPGSPPAFNYFQPADVLYIGGSANGVFGADLGTDDYFMAIGSATTPTPDMFLFIYTSASVVDGKFVSSDPLILTPTATTPEPATLSLLGLGLASAGVRRWRRRKS